MIHSSPVDSFVFGFQILPKHESPADAYKPLYTYKKSVGDIFFYDAVCKSHEQAMARIPSYYLEVRGYHDHFHSYTHKCRKYFNLERLQDRNVTSYFQHRVRSILILSSKALKLRLIIYILTILYLHYYKHLHL